MKKSNNLIDIDKNEFVKNKLLFIYKFLGKDVGTYEPITQIECINNDNTKSRFREIYKVTDNKQEEINIRQLINQGKIKVEDLTPEQKDKMIIFYKSQIQYKKQKLENIKNRLLKL